MSQTQMTDQKTNFPGKSYTEDVLTDNKAPSQQAIAKQKRMQEVHEKKKSFKMN